MHNTTLKTKKLDQGTTQKFTPEFEKEESLWNVMSEILKNCDAKKQVSKDFLNYLRRLVINWKFSYYLFACYFAC